MCAAPEMPAHACLDDCEGQCFAARAGICIPVQIAVSSPPPASRES